jgi:hypothetical protein
MFDEAIRDGWRGLAQIVGWCHGGWDAQFPQAWPPEPGCGTGFADLFRHEESHVAGILDNYADTYARVPGFPQGVMRRADGSLLEGGIWSGGQSYLLDYRQGLPIARANAAHYRETGVQGIYCDTTTAVQLYENHDPAHRGTRADDEAARLALLAMFRDQGLTIGSEKGCDFGIPVVDWSPSGFRYQPGETIPLWPLVFHDCHIQFCPALGVQPEATAAYTPDLLERHRRAWLPYLCHGHQLGHVRVTHGNWHLHRELLRGMAWVDPIQQRVAGLAMVDHRILAPGVERSVWADGTAITINATDQPMLVASQTVPAWGHLLG